MAEYGLTDDGIESPAYNEIISFLAQKWKEEFGQEIDLSSRSPEGQFLRTIALMFTSKGIEWSDKESLWDVTLDVYFSAYVGTASGISLDRAVDRRALTRKDAQPASGTLVFYGDEGEVIPLNTEAQTSSGIEFITTREATINQFGVADTPAKAIEPGEEGNVVTNSIVESENYEVDNPIDSHNRVLGSMKDRWVTISNDNTTDQYQLLNVNDIKYRANVDRFTFPVESTTSGLYAIDLVIMKHDSGSIVNRTETKEITLEHHETKELVYSGEGFDFGDLNLDETLRVAIRNYDYSAGDISVPLDEDSPYLSWYNGTSGQQASLVMSVLSRVNGRFFGGLNAETDAELRTRYQKELDRGGGNRPNAIESELYEIPSLKHAKVYENDTHVDHRPEGGLPPHSIEAVVLGGAKEKIMEILLSEKSAGTHVWGNRLGTITDEYGQTHRLRWSRAEQAELYLKVNLVTGPNFPADGDTEIKDQCAEIIGGRNTKSSFLNGQFGVGDTVYQSEVESELHNAINGLKSVNILMGESFDTVEDGDFDISERETPVVRPQTIAILN